MIGKSTLKALCENPLIQARFLTCLKQLSSNSHSKLSAMERIGGLGVIVRTFPRRSACK